MGTGKEILKGTDIEEKTIDEIAAEMRGREDLNGGDLVDNFDIAAGEYGGFDALQLIHAYGECLDRAIRRERDRATPKRVYIVVETSCENGGEPDTRIAHVCATRLRAQELMEQDGAFIADMPESTLHENRYHGKNDEWEYDYCVMEMEVEA